jgi:cytochrome P450
MDHLLRFYVPLAVVLAIVAYVLRTSSRKGLKLPPGPKPLPIVGNVSDFPPPGVPEFQHWLRHKNIYGPISSVNALGKTLILIHDKDMANTILEKKASKTSKRPEAFFANDMCGFDMFSGSHKCMITGRRRHKMILRHFGTSNRVRQYNDTFEAEVDKLLYQLLIQPTGLINQLKTSVPPPPGVDTPFRIRDKELELTDTRRSENGAVALKLAYGYSIERSGKDPLIAMIDQAMANFSAAVVPLKWVVDVIPSARHLPEWLPGMSFKQTARGWRRLNQNICDIPYAFAKSKATGDVSGQSSYISTTTLEESKTATGLSSAETADDIKYTAASIYAAGSDTTVSSLASFFLAMIMFPEVQRKAQKEIDAVVGSDRFPTLDDRDKLPFVDAIVKETHRWNPVLPMCMPHEVEEDMEYAGYAIPKGAYLVPSVWWLCHDPLTYAAPDSFDPDRYLEPRNEPDPKIYTFGFGRRRCPGRVMADTSMYINIVRILASLDIRRAPDQGNAEIKLETTPGAITYPKEFKYTVVARSKQHEEAIRRAAASHGSEVSDAARLGPLDGLEDTPVPAASEGENAV